MIYEVFILDIPHGNFTACYNITTKYLGITKDETMAVGLSSNWLHVYQAANGQFCNIPTPFQPLANPPTCTLALYGRNLASISALCSLQVRKTSDVNMPSQIAPMFGFLPCHFLHWKALSPWSAQEKLQCSLMWISPSTYWQYLQLAALLHQTFTCPQVSNSTLGSQHLSGYSKSSYNKYFIVRFPCMETRHSYSTWPPYPQFQWTKSTSIWSMALNTSHLSTQLISQQEIQIWSGHCSYIEEYMLWL